MPQFHSNAADTAGLNQDAFTAAYIKCIYFTDTGDGDQPDSEVTMSDELIECISEDCAEWQKSNVELLAVAYTREGYDATQAGYDYWYTRNGHGVGFWSRDALEADDLGEQLTCAARMKGGYEVYQGDDGLLY